MPQRRPHCLRCLRPEAACLCPWVRPTANEVDVFVLQHPSERNQAKGTARLLQLGLQRCVLMVGEALAEDIWRAVLDAPAASGVAMHNLLLYPATPPSPDFAAGVHPQGAAHTESAPPQATRLIVLDGTWRKSLKMLHANPALQALPRLSLDMSEATTGQAMAYRRLRPARRPDQLSTLEATCLALSQLEANTERYAPMLAALDDFSKAQINRMPALPDAGA